MESLLGAASFALGLEAEQLTVWQMGARAAVVYVVGVVLVRTGEKRFIGKFSAFDVIIAIMIGSVLSRAITTPGDFFAKLAAALVLVFMHYAFATLAYHFDWFGTLVKGRTRKLVVHGEIQWDAMRRSHISEKDLKSQLRENTGTDDISQIEEARLERNGSLVAILRGEKQ